MRVGTAGLVTGAIRPLASCYPATRVAATASRGPLVRATLLPFRPASDRLQCVAHPTERGHRRALAWTSHSTTPSSTSSWGVGRRRLADVYVRGKYRYVILAHDRSSPARRRPRIGQGGRAGDEGSAGQVAARTRSLA